MVREITVQELSAKMSAKEPIVLVDVRHPVEHDLAKLPGSVLVPLHELATRWREIRVPDGAAVVVYCHHGVRSRTGAQILENAGFADPMSLAGGIDGWSRLIDPGIPRY